MSCTNPWMSDRTTTGIITEDDCGTLQATAPYPLVVTSGGAQITPVENPLVSNDVSGSGRTIDAQQGLESGDTSWEETHLYSDNRKTIAAFFRAPFVGEITVALVATGDFILAGARLDGSTGPQIRALTGAFDLFINHDGATAGTNPNGGAEKLLFYVEGAGIADNNGFRVVDAIHDDTVNAFMDLNVGWNSGVAGAPGPTLGAAPGSPIQAATGETISITLGAVVRDKFDGPGVTTLSMLQRMRNDDQELWQYLTGLAGNDLVMQWTDKGFATLQAGWIGQRLGIPTTTDPTAQGFVDSNIWGERFSAANNLLMSVIFSPTLMLPMAGFCQTGLTWTVGGNTSGEDNISGTPYRTGTIRGSHTLAATLPWTLKHTATDTRVLDMIKLGRFGPDQSQAGMTSIFHDRKLGHVTAWLGHQGLVGVTAPQSQAVGATITGSTDLTFHQVNGAPLAGMAAYLEFDGILAA